MGYLETAVKYLDDTTKVLFKYIEKRCLDIGNKCDNYMDNNSARRKYWCEVLLRVPLIFIIHQWLLVSPYSNYWMIDVVLFLVRYGGALMLIGTWAFNAGVLIQAYITLTLDIAITWIRHVDYWTNQDSVHGICHEKNVLVWSDVTDYLNLPMICSIILQLVYLCVRPGALTYRSNEPCVPLIYIGLLLTLIPKVLAFLGVFPAFLSEFSYWIDSILLCTISLLEVTSLMDVDAQVDNKKLIILSLKIILAQNDEMKRKCKLAIDELNQRIVNRNKGQNYASRFPGKWFVRDTILLFGSIYLLLLVLIEVTVYQRPILSMISLNSLLDICAMWCTTHIIVICISFSFSLISNVAIALSHWFLTTEINLVETFNTNIGGIVQVAMIITFTEANVLALDNFEKVEVMKLVGFLSICAIVFQTLDVLERKILQAVNSATSPGILFYVRCIILFGLLATIPSLSTLLLARSLNISPWLLFFASGNCTLFLRIFSLMLECTLVKVTWYTTNHLTQVEDVLHYSRACKTLSLVVINCAQCYCRYICPFFKGWWFLRLCLALFSFVVVAAILGWSEFERYKTRNIMFTLLRNFQDVTFHKDTDESDEENTHDCAICYNEMINAKQLPCKHVFHYDCLRKWFQVRTICPLCNTEIRVQNTHHQRPENAQEQNQHG